MRQAIRALGWATNVFWIILLFFTVTVVYSAFQVRVEPPEEDEFYVSSLDGTLVMSMPFDITNGGFYDISNFTITTLVKDSSGLLISDSSTTEPLIQRGSNVSIKHNMSISINQMTTENLSYLLFNDSLFDVGIALKLNYASVVPFQISTNFTMPWEAPLNNLTIRNVSVAYNGTNFVATVPISFENHSIFSLDGTVRVELVDNMNRVLGSGAASFVPNVPPESSYSVPVEVVVSDPTNIRTARLYFATSIFSYGPVVISLV